MLHAASSGEYNNRMHATARKRASHERCVGRRVIRGVIPLTIMAKLIRWETPFSDAQGPSVGLMITSDGVETDILKAVVAPKGIDAYPKYVVNFGQVIAFTCFEEAHAPERDFASATVDGAGSCAYRYSDSPWLQSYEAHEWLLNAGEFSHYLIFGGDNNIEVITPNIPTIEVIEEKTILKIMYEV